MGISGTGYMVLNIGVNRYIENGDGSPIVDVDVGLSLSAKDVLTIDELIDYKTILKHKTVMIEKIILASELNVSNAKIKSRKVKL